MGQTVWIARHGNRLDFVYPEWFETAERRYDPPLSEDGFKQAQKLGQRLRSEKIAHIFASPFLRAIQTAYPAAEALNLPIKIEAGLSEWFNPDWMSEPPVTHPQELLAESYPRLDWHYTSRLIPQYPESEEILWRRTGETARRLIAEFSDNILLVGHSASVLGTVQGLVGGNSRANVNSSLCCLVKLIGEREGWQIALNGDTSYLKD